MTAAEMMRLEALRTTCLAAMNSCQSAVQAVEAMLMTSDAVEAAPHDDSTFDDSISPPGAPNGTLAKKRVKR